MTVSIASEAGGTCDRKMKEKNLALFGSGFTQIPKSAKEKLMLLLIEPLYSTSARREQYCRCRRKGRHQPRRHSLPLPTALRPQCGECKRSVPQEIHATGVRHP